MAEKPSVAILAFRDTTSMTAHFERDISNLMSDPTAYGVAHLAVVYKKHQLTNGLINLNNRGFSIMFRLCEGIETIEHTDQVAKALDWLPE
jgi:hypothetical protein